MKSYIALFILLLGAASSATAGPVNLSTWLEEGPGGGVWTVSSGGDAVYQSVNSVTPTFFISDSPFINNTFEGSLTVQESGGDNDFIGFVFGYTAPFAANGDSNTDFNYLLFDWKQGNQATASEGFYLSEVTGSFANNSISHGNTGVSNPFWSHVDNVDGDSSFTVLDSDTGTGRGWLDNTTYDFILTYQSNNIRIAIDGGQFSNETIFDVAGSFSAGSFGFYNFSQARVNYEGFEEEVAPVPAPSGLVLLLLGLIGVATRRKS